MGDVILVWGHYWGVYFSWEMFDQMGTIPQAIKVCYTSLVEVTGVT